MNVATVLILLGVAGLLVSVLLWVYPSWTSTGDVTHLVRLHGSLLIQRDAPSRLRAMSTFAGLISPAQRARQRDWLTGQLTALAPEGPEQAAAAVLALHEPDPTTVPPAAARAIQLAWVQHATPNGFDDTWQAVSRMLPGGEDAVMASVQDVLTELGPARVSTNFRHEVGRRLRVRLSEPGSADGLSGAVTLLTLMAEPGSGGSPQHWYCVIGDAARRRGDAAEASAYYRKAVDGGYLPARARLAHLLALQGHQLISEGQAHRATALLRTAHSLNADPEYRLLWSVARLLADPSTAEQVARELEPLRGNTPDADFWLGVAQLESGDPAGAAETLRRSLTGTRASSSPGLAELAETLLIIADGGGNGTGELARHLLTKHGSSWSQHCPVGPDQVVIGIAESEPTLLGPLLAGFPGEMQLDLGARKRAAHALLNRAVSARHAGLALSRLELAEKLLEDR